MRSVGGWGGVGWVQWSGVGRVGGSGVVGWGGWGGVGWGVFGRGSVGKRWIAYDRVG